MQSLLDPAWVHDMEQTTVSIYYDSNSETDDNDDKNDSTFQDAIQVENDIDDTEDGDATIYWETINNDFIVPIGKKDVATEVTIVYEGVLHV